MIIIPNTGILAFEPKGTWYVANGIFSNNKIGITNVHSMTWVDNIISHNASLMCMRDISYKYIARRETEHENVRVKTVLGRKLRICFSMR